MLGSLSRGCRKVPYNGHSGECIHSNFDVRKFFDEASVARYMINEDMANVTVCLCYEDKCDDMHFKLVTPQQSYQTSAISSVSTETDPGDPLSEVDLEYAALTASDEAGDFHSENNIVRANTIWTIGGFGDKMTTDVPGGLGDITLSDVDREYAALTASTEADAIKSENNIVRAVTCNMIMGIVVHFL